MPAHALVFEIKSKFNGDMRLTKRVIEILADYNGPFVVKFVRSGHCGLSSPKSTEQHARLHRRAGICLKSDSFLSPEQKHGWRTVALLGKRSRTSCPGA